jgi:hypothetical protein
VCAARTSTTLIPAGAGGEQSVEREKAARQGARLMPDGDRFSATCGCGLRVATSMLMGWDTSNLAVSTAMPDVTELLYQN